MARRRIGLVIIIVSMAVWAKAQVLDFSDYNFDSTKIITLKGQWNFYWDKLLAPNELKNHQPDVVQMPHSWLDDTRYPSYGVGTYQVKILLPQNSNGQLSIYIPFIRCAGKIFLNGVVTDSLGTVGRLGKYHSRFGGLMLSLPSGKEIDLVIQVANYEFRWGGIGFYIKLGKTAEIARGIHKKTSFDLFFVGILVAVAIYLVTMFFLYRTGYSFLFLALICIAVVFRSVSSENGSILFPEMFYSIGWAFWKKVEFVSVYATVALFPLYVSNVFTEERKRWIDLFFIALGLVLCSLALFTPHKIYVLVLDVYHVGLLLGFVYACYMAVKAWRKKNQDAKTLSYGLLATFPFIFMEILKNSALQIPIPFTHLVEFGVVTFLMFQVYVLASHYALTYRALEIVVKEKTAELTESNEIKNRLLAILSHDVKGPVHLLKATLNLFNKGHITNEELKPITAKIESQTSNVSLLIENVLLLVKSQLHGIEIQYDKFNLLDWVQSHLSLYSIQATEKNISLLCSISPVIKVKADQNVLSLALRNLISNAIKFSDEGSSIEVFATEETDLIKFSIKDHGRGMTQRQVESIFENKKTKSELGTQKESGTGLGLKLTREYLLKMETDFEILSDPGKGTLISILLQKGN